MKWLKSINEFNISYYGHGVNFNHPNIRSHFGEKGDVSVNKENGKDRRSFYIVDNEYMSDLEVKKLISQYKHWCQINNETPIDLSQIDSNVLSNIKDVITESVSEIKDRNYSDLMKKISDYLPELYKLTKEDIDLLRMLPNNKTVLKRIIIPKLLELVDEKQDIMMLKSLKGIDKIRSISNPRFLSLIRKNFYKIFTEKTVKKILEKIKFLKGFGDKAEEKAMKYFNKFPNHKAVKPSRKSDIYKDTDIMLVRKDVDKIVDHIQVKRGKVIEGEDNIKVSSKFDIKDKIKWSIIAFVDIKDNMIYYIRKENIIDFKREGEFYKVIFKDGTLNKDSI